MWTWLDTYKCSMGISSKYHLFSLSSCTFLITIILKILAKKICTISHFYPCLPRLGIVFSELFITGRSMWRVDFLIIGMKCGLTSDNVVTILDHFSHETREEVAERVASVPVFPLFA